LDKLLKAQNETRENLETLREQIDGMLDSMVEVD
jgi:hypothetical protein